MKHLDEKVDSSAQITQTAEFLSEQAMTLVNERGGKCIHLCNLSSATIYFFRVTRLYTACRNFEKSLFSFFY